MSGILCFRKNTCASKFMRYTTFKVTSYSSYAPATAYQHALAEKAWDNNYWRHLADGRG